MQELVETFEVSLRSIQRDTAVLQSADVHKSLILLLTWFANLPQVNAYERLRQSFHNGGTTSPVL